MFRVSETWFKASRLTSSGIPIVTPTAATFIYTLSTPTTVIRKNIMVGRESRALQIVRFWSAMSSLSALFRLLYCASHVFVDALIFFGLTFRSASALAAENLFLRKQLVLYVERNKKPRRATDPIRFTLAYLSRYFDWRDALTVVKPDTLIRWHRKGFRLFWKW